MPIMIDSDVVIKPINEIKPYIKNPRINEKTVDLLVQIIPKVGFNVPLVVDKRGVIVKGHARYNAALRLGMEELPCIVTHASAAAIKADRLTDNKIQEFTRWDSAMLKEEVGAVDFEALGIDVYDFGLEEMDFDVLTQQDLEGGEVEDNRKKPCMVTIHFKSVPEFRDNEEKIREFLNQFEMVDVQVDKDEDQ